MLRNYASEALPRYKLHHLCEQRLAYVHAILRVVETQKHRKTVSADSNRGHPQIVRNHTQYCTYSPPQTNEPDTSDLRYAFYRCLTLSRSGTAAKNRTSAAKAVYTRIIYGTADPVPF